MMEIKRAVVRRLSPGMYHSLCQWKRRMWKTTRIHPLDTFSESPYDKGFDRTGSVFIHIPKCAGISVYSAFYGEMFPAHVEAWKYRAKDPDRFCRYFKFTIVRHPLARLHSAYRFLSEGGYNPIDYGWARRHARRLESFASFVDWLNQDNLSSTVHLRPQTDWITDNGGNLLVDFIGKYECLETDFDIISNRLGSGILRHLNKSNGAAEVIHEEWIKRRVREIYARDFELLGYDS